MNPSFFRRIVSVFAVLFFSIFLFLEKSVYSSEEVTHSLSSVKRNDLKTVSFDSTSQYFTLKIRSQNLFENVKNWSIERPGRLVLEIPSSLLKDSFPSRYLTDDEVIPRIRIAQYPEVTRLIFDTVLNKFPSFSIQKEGRVMTVSVLKNPYIIQEARTKKELIEQLQKNEEFSLLIQGSDEEGGILFQDGKNALSSVLSGSFLHPGLREKPSQIVEPIKGKGGQIILALDDRKSYKIFLEDTEQSVQIRKVRPISEVRGIQTRLSLLGYQTGLSDGKIGPMTQSALKKFQKENGLRSTGRVDRSTEKVLRQRFGY